MQVLVVGAGAVGQVFGRHLLRAGAGVTFFVREKYRAEASRGFDMHPLNGPRRAEPVRFDGFAVVATTAEVAARRFDQVYLTVSSTGVQGPWLPELIAAVGYATVVSLQPTAEDREVVLSAGVSEDRLVSGLISLISYAAPLPGETRFGHPGMAYWFPPLSPSQFSGPPERTRGVVALLKRGGLPAKRHPNIPRAVSFSTAVLMAYVAAVEVAGWSLRWNAFLQLGAHAAREATAIVQRSFGGAPLMARLVTSPLLIRVGLWFARWVVPFPLEAYVKRHFTKVGDQTRLILGRLLSDGRAAGLPVDALEKLVAAIGP